MSKPTAIGYLVSQYPTVNHTFVLREIQSLRRAGMDISVVSIHPPDRDVAGMTRAEIEEHERTQYVLGTGPLRILSRQAAVFFGRPVRYLKTLWFAWSLSRGAPRMLLMNTAYFAEAVIAGHLFRKQDVDLVHTHFSSTVLLLMARLFDLRYSMTIHGPDEFNDVVGFHMARKVAGASLVATISQYGASQVMRATDPGHWSKVKTFRLGVDPDLLVPRDPPSPRDGGATRLLFVGRLAAAKAPHLLVQAVAALKARGKPVALTIVGDGPLRDSLQQAIAAQNLEDCVELAGACNFDTVLEHYHRTDLFVLPSFAEGVPVVLMEAMAMEVPCVSTWITGIPELITDGVDGLLVPPASVDALVDAVARLVDDPELARRIGKAGRDKVLSTYHLEHNSRRLGDELAKVACTPRS